MPSSKGFRWKKEKRSDDTVPLGDILAGLLQRREFATGTMIGRLAGSWEQVVGERLASECAPVRLESGTLTVAARSGPWGSQVGFLAGEIRRKANETLGSEAVERVRVVVSEQRSNPL